MRYGTTLMAATILGALVATTPFAAGAADGKLAQVKDKAESTMERAKDKAQSVTQDAKVAISDSWITSKTKIALFADERFKGTQVSVDTQKGVVHLRGKVDSDEAKAAAAEVAKSVEGVQSVKSDLQVVAPVARKAVDANDRDIAKAVESRISKDAQLKQVDVRTDGGVVTLTGEVPSIMAAARASEMARNVPGVKSVKNELTVRQAGK
ncbi:MAG TPA: BON domain-containing protein [Methylomirabilota bacterium]|jgi:hyperosmotically inducible protein